MKFPPNFTRILCDYVFITLGQNFLVTVEAHRKPVGETDYKALKLFDRILEENKQTNQLFLYVQKSADDRYLLPVDNKNSSFIPEQRKNRLNHFLKISNGL